MLAKAAGAIDEPEPRTSAPAHRICHHSVKTAAISTAASGLVRKRGPGARVRLTQRGCKPYCVQVKLEKRVYAIGGLGAVVLVLLLAVVGTLFRHSLRWGDFPSWIIAVTTTLAFGAAAVAARIAYRLYEVESGRDVVATEDRTERREADRRAQANRVAAWFGIRESPRGGGPMLLRGAVILNASDLPIFGMSVTFYSVSDPGTGASWTPVQRGTPTEEILVIPPGVDRFVEISEQLLNTIREVSGERQAVVGIEFTDAAGHRWERDGRGMLKPK